MESTALTTRNLGLLNNSKIKLEGERKLQNNDFFKDLTDLMEDEKFVRFFNKWMCSWADIKSTVIYMKLYSEFKDKYKEISDEELDKSIIVYILSHIMRNKDLRPFSIKTIDKMQEKKWNTKTFWREFEKYMLTNQKQLLIADKE